MARARCAPAPGTAAATARHDCRASAGACTTRPAGGRPSLLAHKAGPVDCLAFAIVAYCKHILPGWRLASSKTDSHRPTGYHPPNLSERRNMARFEEHQMD